MLDYAAAMKTKFYSFYVDDKRYRRQSDANDTTDTTVTTVATVEDETDQTTNKTETGFLSNLPPGLREAFPYLVAAGAFVFVLALLSTVVCCCGR